MQTENPQITSEETKRHAELFRAREMFIDLFSDKSPFLNLGYSSQQINYALPSIETIQNEGILNVKTYLKDNPFLHFDEDMGSWNLSSTINYLSNKEGFYLLSARDRLITEDMSEGERFSAIFAPSPVIIFNKDTGIVAHIALFKDNSRMDDLNYLLPTIYQDIITNAPLGIQEKSVFTPLAKAIKIAGNYQASWVDEKTKLEFVAKIETPEFDAEYVHWRKLRPLTDELGTVYPIGQKAGCSIREIQEILNLKKNKTFLGEIALDSQTS